MAQYEFEKKKRQISFICVLLKALFDDDTYEKVMRALLA